MIFEFDNCDGISIKSIELDYSILRIYQHEPLLKKIQTMRYHANQDRIIGKSGVYSIAKAYINNGSDPKDRYWFILENNKAIYCDSCFQYDISYIKELDICVCNIADYPSDIIDMSNGNIYSIIEDYRTGYQSVEYNRNTGNMTLEQALGSLRQKHS